MLRQFSIKHYLLVSFSAAAVALLGEAICAMCHGGPIRPSDAATNALLIAPSRAVARRPLH